MAIANADVSITITITNVWIDGTWVRLSFTNEAIRICVKRELDCSGGGIFVRL